METQALSSLRHTLCSSSPTSIQPHSLPKYMPTCYRKQTLLFSFKTGAAPSPPLKETQAL